MGFVIRQCQRFSPIGTPYVVHHLSHRPTKLLTKLTSFFFLEALDCFGGGGPAALAAALAALSSAFSAFAAILAAALSPSAASFAFALNATLRALAASLLKNIVCYFDKKASGIVFVAICARNLFAIFWFAFVYVYLNSCYFGI